MVLFVVACFVLVSCGNETSLRSILACKEWNIIKMTGFPDDNVAEGTLTYFNVRIDDESNSEEPVRFRLHYYDGVNWGHSVIKWNESGFAVTATGDTTGAGVPDGEGRYLRTFFGAGSRIEIVQNVDGSVTLTKAQHAITVEPMGSVCRRLPR